MIPQPSASAVPGAARDEDAALRAHVRPDDWENPAPAAAYNLVVLGGGPAGLIAALGAAGLGARVALVEKQRLGGDCLLTGCVPSKALLEVARVGAAAREAARLGLLPPACDEAPDFSRAMAHMRGLRLRLAAHDAAARLRAAGVDVFFGAPAFLDARTVAVGSARLRFARALVATGARPAALDVPGAQDVDLLTSDTVFELRQLPARLVVIGGGPIGCELAQAFRRFGAEVTLVEQGSRLLPKDDPEASEVIGGALEREGVRCLFGEQVRRVSREGGRVRVDLGGAALVADQVLVAAGRRPNVEGLALDRAGVDVGPNGIVVDDRLRTRNRRIFAAGDVCSATRLTHAADAQARIALQNALFFGRARASALVIPWCTYTDPEVAHVGLTASQAAGRGDVLTLTIPLSGNDRAVLEGHDRGFARVHVSRRHGRVLGATCVAPRAGELIAEMALAVSRGLRLAAIGATIHPYPTGSELWKRLADQHRRTQLTPWVARSLRRLFAWRAARVARGAA